MYIYIYTHSSLRVRDQSEEFLPGGLKPQDHYVHCCCFPVLCDVTISIDASIIDINSYSQKILRENPWH